MKLAHLANLYTSRGNIPQVRHAWSNTAGHLSHFASDGRKEGERKPGGHKIRVQDEKQLKYLSQQVFCASSSRF